MAKIPPIKVPVEVEVNVAEYTGSLTGTEDRPRRETCQHECKHCGQGAHRMLADMVLGMEAEVLWPNERGGGLIPEKFRVTGVGGGLHLKPVADKRPEIPPPPPEVWLVYKHGGRYDHGQGPLQGIYSDEDGAKDSVRFVVKEERRSLQERLGQPVTEHGDEEPPLVWKHVRHWRHGVIPNEFWATAGLADFTVKKYKVPEGYLPDTKWCKVPHVTEEENEMLPSWTANPEKGDSDPSP